MNFEVIVEELKELNVGEILEFEPMYKHTTYKVGGPARIYVKVENTLALQKLMQYVKQHQISYYVIGKGSNILFSDKEFDGIIISLNECFKNTNVSGDRIEADAGVSVIRLAQLAMKHGLSGLEFILGIPASVGGVVYMNAGAYKSDVSAVLEQAYILNSEGEVIRLNNTQMEFGYRHSIMQVHPDWVVLKAIFKLQPKDKEEIKHVMDSRKQKRMLTQPWDRPSAGSVFRNPENKAAWQYIDECDLRGFSIGHAKVSTKHSNFIINTGYASAKDIRSLIEHIQNTVKTQFGIELYTEVRFMNWD